MSYDKHAIISSLPTEYQGTATDAESNVYDIATTTIGQSTIVEQYGAGSNYELSIYGVDDDFEGVEEEDFLALDTDQDTAKKYIVIGKSRWAGGCIRIDLGKVQYA